MWTQDFVRVLQGAGKVAEQLARAQGPEVAARSSQLSKHATELARLVPYFLSGEGSAAAPVKAESAPQEKAPALQQQVDAPKPQQSKAPPLTAEKIERKTPQPVKTITPPVLKAPQSEKTITLPEEKKTITPPVLDEEPPRRVWEEKHVPSSPLSRILGFGGLAARLAVGTAAEIVRSGGKNGTYNALVSDSNAEKLAETLCTMRGAALKLGQMLSIQDEAMIPSKLAVALDRVREK
ncbi:unnamed protein product [Phytophthora fragariaefolia]|uniref:Unnamed protein product n=1 Tax=Phytophthora fragariaefolia TaxID=1490495 RepID=A0A9W7CZE0_9STRA|nr:unnamed protein product [Phytophthora fragariaefolia]